MCVCVCVGGAIRFRSDTKVGGASLLEVRYTISGGGGGAIRFRSDTKRGGGGGDKRLQF